MTRSLHTGPNSAHTDGFTVIELMVAIGLGLVVVALAVTAISRGLNGQRAAAEQHKAQQAAAEALDVFSDDVRTAVAPNRLITSAEETPAGLAGLSVPKGTRDALKQLLLHPDAGVRDQYRDIKVATSSTVIFRSNVVSRNSADGTMDNASECVRWQITDGFMVRTIWPSTSVCPGSASDAIESRRMFRVHPQLGNTAFHYTIQRKFGSDANATCESRIATDGVALGARDAYGYYQIDRISGIGVNFVAAGAAGEGSGESDMFTLRGRQTADYLFAIGCGY